MLKVAALSGSAEGRYVETCDPICEVCSGYGAALTIYVIGAENSDGRNTWDWTRLPWRGSDRGVVFGLTVRGRTDDVPYLTVRYQLSAPGKCCFGERISNIHATLLKLTVNHLLHAAESFLRS